jgi:hypothetical protein
LSKTLKITVTNTPLLASYIKQIKTPVNTSKPIFIAHAKKEEYSFVG